MDRTVGHEPDESRQPRPTVIVRRLARRWIGPGLAMLALSGGCQSGSGDGLPVSGRLHQGDRPVETDGVLTLLPERSSSAPAVSTPITEGHFEFRRENGPRAGRYQALVNLFEADDPGQAPGAGDKLGPLGPPERGELRIAVEIAAEGPWVLDLQLPADHPEASR